ncbi:MAG TPA: universal stress protein [Methanocella sp.]|jgi:nucleotide-binding universal stress UspA family protein
MAELFSKILIATDGSKYSRDAAAKALEIARFHGSKVYVLYVIDLRALTSVHGMPAPNNIYMILADDGKHAVGEVKEMAGDLPVEKFVLAGHPAHTIVQFAQDNGIDLIVAGTLGKSGVEKLLLGSVAGHVIRHAPCPVLVVKSMPDPGRQSARG